MVCCEPCWRRRVEQFEDDAAAAFSALFREVADRYPEAKVNGDRKPHNALPKAKKGKEKVEAGLF